MKRKPQESQMRDTYCRCSEKPIWSREHATSRLAEGAQKWVFLTPERGRQGRTIVSGEKECWKPSQLVMSCSYPRVKKVGLLARVVRGPLREPRTRELLESSCMQTKAVKMDASNQKKRGSTKELPPCGLWSQGHSLL